MHAESRERAIRIGVVPVVVRTVVVDNWHIRGVATVCANGLIPKNNYFCFTVRA